MDGTTPTPPRKRKWAHRGGTCEKHGNACAMRRDVLDPESVWTCVECEHEAGTLLASATTEPAPSPAPATSPLEPARPPAPTASPGDAKPADAVGGGAGASLSRQTPSQAEAVEGLGGVCSDGEPLDHAVVSRAVAGLLSRLQASTPSRQARYLRAIALELDTESKRLRVCSAPGLEASERGLR